VAGLAGLLEFAADDAHIAYVRTPDPISASWALLVAPP